MLGYKIPGLPPENVCPPRNNTTTNTQMDISKLSLDEFQSFEDVKSALANDPAKFNVVMDDKTKLEEGFWDASATTHDIFNVSREELANKTTLIEIFDIQYLNLTPFVEVFKDSKNYIYVHLPLASDNYEDDGSLVDFFSLKLTHSKIHVHTGPGHVALSDVHTIRNVTFDECTQFSIDNPTHWEDEEKVKTMAVEGLVCLKATVLVLQFVDGFPKMKNNSFPELLGAVIKKVSPETIPVSYQDPSVDSDFSFLQGCAKLVIVGFNGPLLNYENLQKVDDLEFWVTVAPPEGVGAIKLPALNELKILVIFPNIKTLPVIEAPDLLNLTVETSDECKVNGSCELFSNVTQIIPLYPNLKELNLTYVAPFSTLNKLPTVLSKIPALKNLFINGSNLDYFNNPSLSLKTVEQLTIGSSKDVHTAIINFNAPSLQVLNISIPYAESVTAKNMPSLLGVKSNSKFLNELVLEKTPNVEMIYVENTLRSLKADSLTKMKLLKYGLYGSDTKKTVEKIKKKPGLFKTFVRDAEPMTRSKTEDGYTYYY